MTWGSNRGPSDCEPSTLSLDQSGNSIVLTVYQKITNKKGYHCSTLIPYFPQGKCLRISALTMFGCMLHLLFECFFYVRTSDFLGDALSSTAVLSTLVFCYQVFASTTILSTKNFSTVILWTAILSTAFCRPPFVDRHFVDPHYVDRHYVDSHFVDRHLFDQDLYLTALINT